MRRAASAPASYQATHDVLTSLHNRNSFQERFPDDRKTGAGLALMADLAMKAAKADRTGTMVTYKPEPTE